MSDDDDGEIRRLLQSGEPGERKRANAKVLEAHGPALRRYVRSHAPQGADVAELEDVCWEGIFKALGRLKPGVPVVAVVIGVARHKVTDAFGASSYDALPSQISGVPALFPGRDSGPLTPSAELQRREDQKDQQELERHRLQRIQGALARLRESDRELLDLRWIQGLKPKAIAHILGGDLKATTISQRIVAAGKRFNELLQSGPRG